MRRSSLGESDGPRRIIATRPVNQPFKTGCRGGGIGKVLVEADRLYTVVALEDVHRRPRSFQVGDVVFRRLPKGPRSSGGCILLRAAGAEPLTVVRVVSDWKVVLADSRGRPVDGGQAVPCDQLIQRPTPSAGVGRRRAARSPSSA